jgi:type II secretory pathway pseudopilin PulG
MPGQKRRSLVWKKKILAVLGLVGVLTTAAATGTGTATATAQADERMSSGRVATATDDGRGVGIKLLDIPAARQSDPRARTYIVDQVDPGNVIKRRVQIQNNSGSDKVVYVYSGSATVTDGSFVGDAFPSQNELTTWITLEHSQLEMAAGSTIDVLATIAVPVDAAEGEQYAAIWAEVRSAPGAGSSIVQASRAGVRIYLSVEGSNGIPADFTIGSLTPARDSTGAPTLSTRLVNTGGRAIDVSGELTLAKGPAGLSAGPFAVQRATTLAPGDSGEVVFTLSEELPNGPWEAALALTSGLVERSAAATVTFPDAGVGETVAPNGRPVLLISLISAGAVVLLLAAGTVWWLRRRLAQGATG